LRPFALEDEAGRASAVYGQSVPGKADAGAFGQAMRYSQRSGDVPRLALDAPP
jgi:hypothetical protein